jgi:4,5-DOPA dioxygenase extradiol
VSRAPAAFVAHGAPTVALDRGGYAEALARLGERLAPARALLVVSAHWTTAPGSVAVGGAERPRTVHDFGGFPAALYRLAYPAPGDPALAAEAAALLRGAGFAAKVDPGRGLDHGAWTPLLLALPQATVPVVPVSVPFDDDPARVVALGRALAPLREQGVAFVGSGGIVHNLGRVRLGASEGPGDPWAAAFDAWVAERLDPLDLDALLGYRQAAPHAQDAVPTPEHLDPLFAVLGAAAPGERVHPVFEGFHHGSLSMRSFELR